MCVHVLLYFLICRYYVCKDKVKSDKQDKSIATGPFYVYTNFLE